MTDCVVEVGPEIIRGPNDVDAELVSVALESVDDELALIDDRPVSVPELWADVMRAAVNGGGETAVLVCPTWWSTARVERVRGAAQAVASTVVVWRRTALLRDSTPTSVVEIARELTVVTDAGARVAVIAHVGGATAVAQQVVDAVGVSKAVLIDAPPGVDDAVSQAIAARLRANGVAVARTAEDTVRRAAAARRAQELRGSDARPSARRRQRTTAMVAGAVVATAIGTGVTLSDNWIESPTGRTTLLVEGRIGVLVPADWPVERVTSGPGSPRLQLVSPADGNAALHVTQSPNAPGADLAATAAALTTALAAEPDGVFVDFDPSAVRADRPALTYREVRAARLVAWTVLVSDDVRIAIGCQSAPGREHVVRDICDRAIRSARRMPRR